MEKQLLLQVGKTYKTRNGLTTSPVEKSNNGTNYIFSAKVKEPQHGTPSVCAWLSNGSFLTRNNEHRLDLTQEV